MSDRAPATEITCRFARGAPLDFGAGLLGLLDDHLDQPFDRLHLHQNPDSPKLVAGEVADSVRSRFVAGERPTFSGITPNERAAFIESLSGGFSHDSSGVRWRLLQQSLASSEATVDAMSEVVEVQVAYCTLGNSPIPARNQQRTIQLRSRYELNEALHRQKRDVLLGIAPVQWFGSAFVEAFGGDGVFEALPDGWAEKVAPGLWKVFGAEDPSAFEVERWSDRERALIEALGPEFFFNVETGELATEFVEIPIASQYPVYLWDEAAGELVIHEPDGSTRPANLHDPAAASSSGESAVSGPRALSHLVVERMTEVMGDVFVDDDQLYWVEQHLQVVPELDDVWVEAFSVWLGEHVIAGILDAEWVELDGRWVVSSSRGLFDPEPVVRATVGSEARGESRVMVSAACAAMGIPLP